MPVSSASTTLTLHGHSPETVRVSETAPCAARCPRCGEVAPAGARFCGWCGAPLDDAEQWLGTTVGGRWRLEAQLGEGAIGRVFRAVSTDGERAAVKILHARWSDSAELRERLRREAAALRVLTHPSIVALRDVGETSGRPYLVMELVTGRPLSREILVGGRTMAPARAVHLLAQVLEALEVAHAAGVVHRDIKPDNVMLVDGPGDSVKVLDFGLALVGAAHGVTRLTATGEMRGTPLYMSPEQFRGRVHTAASDVYSVGVVLFELLAGVPPFSARTLTDVMGMHLHLPPPSIAERGARPVSPELERLAHWALAKRPEARPTAAQLRAALLSAPLHAPTAPVRPIDPREGSPTRPEKQLAPKP